MAHAASRRLSKALLRGGREWRGAEGRAGGRRAGRGSAAGPYGNRSPGARALRPRGGDGRLRGLGPRGRRIDLPPATPRPRDARACGGPGSAPRVPGGLHVLCCRFQLFLDVARSPSLRRGAQTLEGEAPCVPGGRVAGQQGGWREVLEGARELGAPRARAGPPGHCPGNAAAARASAFDGGALGVGGAPRPPVLPRARRQEGAEGARPGPRGTASGQAPGASCQVAGPGPALGPRER